MPGSPTSYTFSISNLNHGYRFGVKSIASDGTRGKMMANTTVDGYTLDAQGHWTVDGVVQTK